MNKYNSLYISIIYLDENDCVRTSSTFGDGQYDDNELPLVPFEP